MGSSYRLTDRLIPVLEENKLNKPNKRINQHSYTRVRAQVRTRAMLSDRRDRLIGYRLIQQLVCSSEAVTLTSSRNSR